MAFAGRTIILFGDYFTDFYSRQTPQVQKKIEGVLDIVKQVERIPVTFLKHLEGAKGLFEIRVAVGSNIFRIFCCFDEGRLVVLFNAFQKKTQKTPLGEIAKAQKLMQEYFQTKTNS